MYKSKSFLLLLLLSILSFSCAVEGESESPQFDPAELTLSNKAHNTLILKSKNNVAWWFYSVRINDQLINIKDLTVSYLGEEDKTGYSIIKFEGEWFSVSKKDSQTIEITLTENSDDAERRLSFLAYRGNSWQEITVVQQGLARKGITVMKANL